MKRLLPAATLVIIVVACATPLLPETRWDETSLQIAASAIFIENWALAWLATDYLGSQNPPSPVQHFWSLSVEEQFYFLWPITILAAIAIGRRLHWSPRFTIIAALGAIFVASFTCSLLLTEAEPASALFVMLTRL